MKKIILIILILLNIPAWAWAFNLVTGSSMAVTGGAGPDVWYYSVGTDGSDYASNIAIANTWEVGDNIVIGQAGNITKIGVKVYLKTEPSSTIKIMLSYDNGGTWTKVECGEIASVTDDAWNDFTLVTPYAVTTSQNVMVKILPSDQTGIYYATTSGGHYAGSQTYATWCNGTTTTWGNDYSYAVRVYVD